MGTDTVSVTTNRARTTIDIATCYVSASKTRIANIGTTVVLSYALTINFSKASGTKTLFGTEFVSALTATTTTVVGRTFVNVKATDASALEAGIALTCHRDKVLALESSAGSNIEVGDTITIDSWVATTVIDRTNVVKDNIAAFILIQTSSTQVASISRK